MDIFFLETIHTILVVSMIKTFDFIVIVISWIA